MKIKKYIHNPHVLLRKLKEEFEIDIKFSTTPEEITFHDLPKEINPQQLMTFILAWDNPKTDDEQIKEDEDKLNEEKTLKILNNYLEKAALTQDAKDKIAALKAKENDSTKAN